MPESQSAFFSFVRKGRFVDATMQCAAPVATRVN